MLILGGLMQLSHSRLEAKESQGFGSSLNLVNIQ